ncbi:MAG: ADP-glyceromanno-heptose 6-epimerase [Thermodesulfobacteriota bacterium]|nr:ADP-glyceromanno-heptose 6-epimerase [Thermodesulfobacteriota bacterium]
MVVVTGGAGFIGSWIVWSLNRRGIENILVVDHIGDSEKWKNLRSLRFCDYMEKDAFISRIHNKDPLPDIRTIFHMGACSSTTQTDGSYLVHNNFEYTKALAAYASLRKIRFIYASSAATYGDGAKGFQDDESRMNGLLPLNMYGYSKQLFDLWAAQRDMLSSMVGIKFFNVFGPNENHKGAMRSFVLKGFEQIKKTGSLRLFQSCRDDFRDGEQLRDFVYAADAAAMALFFMDNPRANGIFNVGTGRARSWNDLAGAIFKAMAITPRIEYIAMPEDLKDKYQYYTQADISKIRSAGYAAETMPLEDAVKEYIREYLNNDAHLGERVEGQMNP